MINVLNQVVMVGRITGEIKESFLGEKKVVSIELSVQRPYKNENGEYETDIIPVTLWDGIAQNVMEYCNTGDLVGVKGRLQVNDGNLGIVAEKVTFLSSKAQD